MVTGNFKDPTEGSLLLTLWILQVKLAVEGYKMSSSWTRGSSLQPPKLGAVCISSSIPFSPGAFQDVAKASERSTAARLVVYPQEGNSSLHASVSTCKGREESMATYLLQSSAVGLTKKKHFQRTSYKGHIQTMICIDFCVWVRRLLMSKKSRTPQWDLL